MHATLARIRAHKLRAFTDTAERLDRDLDISESSPFDVAKAFPLTKGTVDEALYALAGVVDKDVEARAQIARTFARECAARAAAAYAEVSDDGRAAAALKLSDDPSSFEKEVAKFRELSKQLQKSGEHKDIARSFALESVLASGILSDVSRLKKWLDLLVKADLEDAAATAFAAVYAAHNADQARAFISGGMSMGNKDERAWQRERLAALLQSASSSAPKKSKSPPTKSKPAPAKKKGG
jgi:hypothetical protein